MTAFTRARAAPIRLPRVCFQGSDADAQPRWKTQVEDPGARPVSLVSPPSEIAHSIHTTGKLCSLAVRTPRPSVRPVGPQSSPPPPGLACTNCIDSGPKTCSWFHPACSIATLPAATASQLQPSFSPTAKRLGNRHRRPQHRPNCRPGAEATQATPTTPTDCTVFSTIRGEPAETS